MKTVLDVIEEEFSIWPEDRNVDYGNLLFELARSCEAVFKATCAIRRYVDNYKLVQPSPPDAMEILHPITALQHDPEWKNLRAERNRLGRIHCALLDILMSTPEEAEKMVEQRRLTLAAGFEWPLPKSQTLI